MWSISALPAKDYSYRCLLSLFVQFRTKPFDLSCSFSISIGKKIIKKWRWLAKKFPLQLKEINWCTKTRPRFYVLEKKNEKLLSCIHVHRLFFSLTGSTSQNIPFHSLLIVRCCVLYNKCSAGFVFIAF